MAVSTFQNYSRVLLLYLVRKKVKCKGKVVNEHHTMKAYCGNGGIAPHILDFGTRWR
jgi:hypothetical protein